MTKTRFRGEFTMTQEEAKAAIVREFHALPEAKQLSTIERLAFVRQMMEKYKFRALGHPYQLIRGWLIRELPDENW
jgi:hypothetical protein